MREKISLDILKWSDRIGSAGFPPFRQLRTPTRTLSRTGAPHPPRAESLTELRDRLRNEITRGKEYLAQVRSELQENRALLDEWAQYELACAFHPLEHLVESVVLKEKVERFLSGWLVTRAKKLQQVLVELEQGEKVSRASSPGASGTTQ